jgi:hypothetical protein
MAPPRYPSFLFLLLLEKHTLETAGTAIGLEVRLLDHSYFNGKSLLVMMIMKAGSSRDC